MTDSDYTGSDLSGQWEGAIETAIGIDALEGAADAPLLRYGFLIGEVGFLLAQEKLGEIVADYTIHPMPNTEKWFVGMVNMRGNLVPVFDLKMLFEYQGDCDVRDNRRLLVLGSGEMAIGILIEGLPLVINLDPCEGRMPDFPDEYTKYIGDIYTDHGRTWMEFDIESFLMHVGSRASMRSEQ